MDRADATRAELSVDIPLDWHQGRTAYGGFSAALAHAAALRLGEDLPPLRSAQFAMIAPLNGEVEARARLVRRGRNACWIGAEILRDGDVGLSASFVFMAPVPSVLDLDRQTPPDALIPPDEAPLFAFREQTPVCLRRNFEVRFALPRRSQRPGELCWWVRLNEREALDPVTELLLIADALPPGVMPLLPPATPISTMHWQCNLLDPAPVTTDGWWVLRSSADYAAGGRSSQRMNLWNANGGAVMAGVQSIAVFG